ncbi:MAG: DUF805 domain-containing protein [Ignavibacteria bacterium]|jgi:uncharacterized membrane protein YhaH (DUF805 family)|nr:DUF805 domain-containing protein [Ignavibacteria bacterium]
MKQYFSFKGRIGRLEYFFSIVVASFYSFAIGFAIGITSIDTEVYSVSMDILETVLSLPAYWLILAQGAKRCHDRGNNGWFQIIPFYGLIMLFAAGEDGANKYGENPI